MNAKAKQKTIVIRAILTVACIAGGFVFPLLFLVAAFFAWTIYSDIVDPKPVPPVDAWYARRWTATSEDPDWKSYFLPFCESPAEEAFLEAMIADYKLLPRSGVLFGSGLELNLQVEHKPYRLDFLANEWLVIEIDGAAYHSSPEAVERDGIRDKFFTDKGFAVVRIPAKVVFKTPKAAVEMVRVAVTKGKPPGAVMVRPTAVSVVQTLLNAAKSVDKFVTDLDANVTKATAVDHALRSARNSFATEKIVVDAAMKTAQLSVDLEARFAADPNLRRRFDEVLARINAAGVRNNIPRPERADPIVIAPITQPSPHQDRNVNEAILLGYLALTGERSRMFDEARRQIANDPRLAPHVQSHLEGRGCQPTWEEIRKPGVSEELHSYLRSRQISGPSTERDLT
ncbi:DUF559 domain-containing protein [Rhizobium leguminosarum]|uniref:endonuclease domain-containing protein n=1 Tax=Rhizobium leguminosarum TaxID=384 RepID=UPI0010321DFD|nr:DUF559 domain-containing protein [Rhizobium leguminosarum]TBD04750.1 DUF559 domain-containing protein [Rhizobium leguminosarum]